MSVYQEVADWRFMGVLLFSLLLGSRGVAYGLAALDIVWDSRTECCFLDPLSAIDDNSERDDDFCCAISALCRKVFYQ